MRRPRIETLLLAAGVALLGWSAVDRARAYVYQSRAERELESMIAAHGAESVDDSRPSGGSVAVTESSRSRRAKGSDLHTGQPTAATRPKKPAAGEARRVVATTASTVRTSSHASAKRTRSRMIGRLEIPRLGIRAMIADGTDSRTLGRAIGHLRHTPMPGERGNVALAAHRDTYFKPLRDVRPRDVIRITTPDGVFAYRVDWTKVVEPKRIDLLRPAKRSELTLITCYPFDAIGPAPRRFVVRAVEIGRESPARS